MYSHVYIEITNICNMSCSFCHGHNRAPQAMSLAQFSSVLDSLEGYTKYIYYHLMGEPLKHPQLPGQRRSDRIGQYFQRRPGNYFELATGGGNQRGICTAQGSRRTLQKVRLCPEVQVK